MNSYSISIAMATYNGSRYLEKQLESFTAQSFLPSELVVCDDCSTDNTVDILKNFSLHAPFPVKIIENSKKLGVTSNFSKAVSLCSGAYIALSDQDDYWLPQKLEKQVTFLENNINKDVVFSNLSIVDSSLQNAGNTMWDYVGFHNDDQNLWLNNKALNILLNKGNVVTGCSIMVRRSFAEMNLRFLDGISVGKLHDEIISLRAAIDNRIGFIDECLILYRQHSNQVVGTTRKNKSKFLFLIERLNLILSSQPIIDQRKAIEYKISWLSALELPDPYIKEEQRKLWFAHERLKNRSLIGRMIFVSANAANKNYFRYIDHVLVNIIRDLFRK